MLDDSIQTVKGVGPKRAAQFQKLGIRSVRELLYHFPREYQDFTRAVPVVSAEDGALVCLRVRLLGEGKVYRVNGITILSVQGADETGPVTLKWFNQPYRKQQLHPGDVTYAWGRCSRKRGLSLLNATMAKEPPGILPVYPSVSGLTQRMLRDTVYAALETHFQEIWETLPPEILSEHALCGLQLALRHIHFPINQQTLEIAKRRLRFENILCYLIAVELQKSRRKQENGIPFCVDGVLEKYLKKLPFAPTDAQLRVLGEVERDMAAPVPMNRLVQGDVGSGKTAIAFYALTGAAAGGYQGALLAPTEILARQHFQEAQRIFGSGAVLLTGSMKKGEREAALERIADGTALCVVGTHALFQQSVRFHSLGLVVTDEQHRFGVQQRTALQQKGVRPDVLVMSATPIPRTLALLLYGDLDLSVIDELPPGRKPVKTRLIPREKREDMYRYIRKEAASGGQAYVVCPCIEDGEESDAPNVEALYGELKKLLPDTPMGKLHGRMPEKSKQAAIDAFRRGDTKILLATTVIEVGVHVPNAGIMVIEGADRFGLSQLHQLRGRVGRGEKQAYCFLLSTGKQDTAMERLQVLCETCDGFEIAQRDLALRGAGDLFGVRQHGEGDAAMLCAPDTRMLEEAKRTAENVIATPREPYNELVRYAWERYAKWQETLAMN